MISGPHWMLAQMCIQTTFIGLIRLLKNKVKRKLGNMFREPAGENWVKI